MAIFKVGDKARIVNAYPAHAKWNGAEVTIIGLPGCDPDWPGQYQIDGPMVRGPWNHWFAGPEQLAPLTDPKADEFIENIKRLKPYEEPKVVKEKA